MEKDPGPEEGRGILRLIAVFKFVKVALLIGVGIGAFRLPGRDVGQQVARWVSHTGLSLSGPLAERVFRRLQFLDTRRLEEIGLASLTYAALFSVEGVGLWLVRPWGEYVTLFITGSFIPFELYELVKEPHAGRVVALALNVAVLVYLAVRVARRRRHRRTSGPPTPGRARGRGARWPSTAQGAA